MNISESTIILINWFSKNYAFCLKNDFNKLLPNHISENLEADKVSIQIALKEIEKQEIIKSDFYGKDLYYILIKPLDSLYHTLSINYETCASIANIINTTAKSLNNLSISSNPLNITEKDIITALTILSEIKVNNEI